MEDKDPRIAKTILKKKIDLWRNHTNFRLTIRLFTITKMVSYLHNDRSVEQN